MSKTQLEDDIEYLYEHISKLPIGYAKAKLESIAWNLRSMKSMVQTEFITFYIVWATGRRSYDEQDSIDSFFHDKTECKEYVKKENDDCRNYSEYYWEEYRMKNPFRQKTFEKEGRLK